MTILKVSTIAAIALIVASCHSSKKSTTSTTTSNGVFAPGEEQLKAIVSKYPDASLPVLSEGYTLYIGETCTRCHGSKSIYSRKTEKWPGIIDEMAHKAKITDAQKDALLKYVLSIKASQPPAAAK